MCHFPKSSLTGILGVSEMSHHLAFKSLVYPVGISRAPVRTHTYPFIGQ